MPRANALRVLGLCARLLSAERPCGRLGYYRVTHRRPNGVVTDTITCRSCMKRIRDTGRLLAVHSTSREVYRA